MCLARQRVMVVYNSEGRSLPGRELSLYDVEVRSFEGEDLEGFARALADAQLLYIGQYSGYAAQENVFGTPERREAITQFLANGGMLFVDYNGLGGGPYEAFFAELGLQHPGQTEGEYYPVEVAPDAEHAILSEPHAITGDLERAYGWWSDWGQSFTCLVSRTGDPGKAALLIADGVAGEGTVILTQLYGIFRDESGAVKDLFENILSYAFGGLPGPGEAVPVYDPYERREPAANPCYLSRAEQAPWHAEAAATRLPVVVGEPIGLQRRAAPVSLSVALPEDVAPESVRVFTWAGYELPCQARLRGEDDRTCEVLTLVDLKPYQQRLLYLYFGGEAAESEAAAPLLAMERSEGGIELRNDRLRVVLDPVVPQPRVVAPLGARVDNELATWRGIDRGRCNLIRHREDMDQYQASVAEDGPVRKTVTYTGPDLTISYALVAGSESLFYEITAQESSGVSRFTGWAPGGDGTHDAMWYEAPEGLKRAVLRTGEFYRPFDDIRSYMKEGWLAFEDERGEVVGEYFDLQQTSRLSPYVHSVHGHTAIVSNRLEDGLMRGAMVAARGDHGDVRRAYLAWKNPPAVLLGQRQTPDDVPQPRVPTFGQDYLRMSGTLHWFFASTTVKEPELVIPRLVREVASRGGNYIIASDRHPEYVEPLLREAHRMGVGVILKPLAFRGGERLCPYAQHDEYVAGARNVAAYRPDGVYLVDEFTFPGNCEACRAAFQEQYGMAMPDEMDFDRLAEPAMHNWVFFKMNVINDLIRDMTAAVREEVPEALVFHVTSPNNHFRLEAYHDLETQSQWLTTTNSDLYSTSLDHTRYMLAHIRGAQGNDKPVFTVNGCMYEADDVALNLRHHLMYGSNAMWYFSINFSRLYPEAAGANADGFRMLRDTGLGQVLASSRPVRYAAVLRSRAGWEACIRRGEKSGRLVDYERRIRERVLLRNLPVEILFSRHFSLDALDDYRLLIVPSEPTLEPEIAEAIAEWVRQGGNVLVEGEAARNEALTELCGVTVSERAEGPADLVGSAAPLEGLSEQFSSAYLNVSAAEGSVVGQIGEAPAVTIRQVGQGRACYVSLLDAPPELIRPLAMHLGGPPPVTVPAEVERDIEVSALSDGSRSVVAVYNRHVSEPRSVKLTLNDLPAAQDARAIEIEGGRVSELDGALSVEVRPGDVSFYLLASPEQYPLAEAAQGPGVEAIHRSLHPGTEFLRLEPEPARSADLPEKDPSKLYVAVLKNLRSPLGGCDLGGDAMVAALQKREDLVVEHVEDLDASALARYEVLVVPNMGAHAPAPNLSEGWEAEVRQFVESGGGALLVHHSVGYMPVSHPMFPEVAEAPDYVPITAMEVAADHPVASGEALRQRFGDKSDDPAFAAWLEETALEVGQQFQSGFADYIKLNPGPQGTTVVVSQRQGNAGGDPTVVAGEVGQGRVVLSGMDLGCRSAEGPDGYEFTEELNPAEAALLTNAVYWLAAP
ncbi:MAG: hypothetical protein U9R79_02530 [Armatimonadota bacterium]|nr:hypothetical protein [Armatimonadota bacterium]